MSEIGSLTRRPLRGGVPGSRVTSASTSRGVRQEWCVPAARHRARNRAIGSCRGQFAAGRSRGRQAIVLAGDHERGHREARQGVAQVRVAQDLEAGPQGRRGSGSPCDASLAAQHAQRFSCACSSPRVCSARKFCTVAAVIPAPVRCVNPSSICGLHPVLPVRVPPGTSGGGGHQDQRARRCRRMLPREFERHACHRATSRATAAPARNVRANTACASPSEVEDVGADQSTAAVTRQVERRAAAPACASPFEPGAPHAAVQCPTVQQHEIGALAADVDVQRHDAWPARELSGSTVPSACEQAIDVGTARYAPLRT